MKVFVFSIILCLPLRPCVTSCQHFLLVHKEDELHSGFWGLPCLSSLLVPPLCPLMAAVAPKTLIGTAASLEHVPFSLASQMKEHLEAESKADYNQTSLSLVIPREEGRKAPNWICNGLGCD